MSAKSLKIIFALLSLSLLSILFLQAYWIRQNYLQSIKDFNTSIYQSLNEIASKLNDWENVKLLKNSLIAENNDHLITNGKNIKILISNTKHKAISQALDPLKNKLLPSLGSTSILDSGIIIHLDNEKHIKVKNKPYDSIKEKEINQLIEKMVTEIEIMDVSEINNISKDSLSSIIEKALQNRGIQLPFDFLLKNKTKSVTKTILKSNGFNTTEKKYSVLLNTNKVLPNYKTLELQFPNERQFLFNDLKKSLSLSIFFSLLIIFAFYYTLQLIVKQKKLSEMKNDFINNMTHELKTPIATISLAIDAIKHPLIKNNEEKFSTYTTILKEENSKLNNHVERVLQMAALEKSELHLMKEHLDLRQIINSALDAHKLQIQNQKAEIHFNQPKTTIPYLADAFHLTTAISNLIDNALKYSKANCQISIVIEKTMQEITIEIKDNGIGIDSTLHQKVFEKFFRASSGNIHDNKGFGLGLSYVKSIIDAHDGQISLDSIKGKGSTFTIKFKNYDH